MTLYIKGNKEEELLFSEQIVLDRSTLQSASEIYRIYRSDYVVDMLESIGPLC